MKLCAFRRRLLFVVCGLVSALCSPAAWSESAESPLRSSWECLPENTLIAVRIPNGGAAVETLKKTTKLGTVALDDKRIEGLRELLVTQGWWEPVQKDLDQYGLSLDDLAQVFAGEIGFAAVMAEDSPTVRDQSRPVPFGLAWLEPGQELSQRLWRVIERLIEEDQSEDHPVTRVDVDVAGEPAMLLMIPQKSVKRRSQSFDVEELSDEQGGTSEFAEEQDGTKSSVRYIHLLLTLRGGRMLVAMVLEPTEKMQDRQRIDRLTTVFERFVSSLKDESGTFASRLQSMPGMRDALPQQGVPVAEGMADIGRLASFAVTESAGVSGEESQKRKQVFEATGLDQLGLLAWRTNLFQSAVHTGLFLEVPSPRKGLLTFLDQSVLESKPPRWVPASVMEYSQLSFDFGDLYTRIKELVIAHSGEQSKPMFDQIEASVTNFAGADVASVLSSLGRRHAMLGFEPRLKGSGAGDDESPLATQDRMALVWAIEDEEIWKKLLNASRAFTGAMAGTVEFREEQGFSGYRLTTPQAEGGVFLGKGYLVVAFGEGVLEQALSTLNNPPEGRDALVNSEVYARAAKLLPLEPGLSFEVSDGNRYAGFLQQSLNVVFDASTWSLDDNEDKEDFDLAKLMEQLRRLAPTAQDLEDMFGISVGYVRATDHGVEIKSVSELPSP